MLCDVGAEQLRDRVHHLISVLTGARKKLCCPNCGSPVWYKIKTIEKHYSEWNDGYSDWIDSDNVDTMYSCDECGHDE